MAGSFLQPPSRLTGFARELKLSDRSMHDLLDESLRLDVGIVKDLIHCVDRSSG